MENQKYIEIKKKVVENYKIKILPRCRNLEEKRKKIIKISNIALAIAIILSILLFWHFKPIIISILLVCAVRDSYAKKFEVDTKNLIMPFFCECFEDLEWYSANTVKVSNIEEYEEISNSNENISTLLEETKLFYTDASSKYKYDDMFKGTYKEVPFELFELNSYTVHRSGKNRSTTIRFEGLIIKIKMNKKFTSNTVILPNSFIHTSPGFNLKHSVFEDVEFEKKFDVFTNDEVEARYLITTSFMERLNNLKAAFNTDKISCSFYSQELFIGLHTNKDLFKLASINKPMTDYSEFSKMFKEVLSIYEMIDYLKLTEKTKL